MIEKFDSSKERIIQEFVPGKQITLAHIIPNPVSDLYSKMGMIDGDGAIGIFTITPSEGAIIAADVASKGKAADLLYYQWNQDWICGSF